MRGLARQGTAASPAERALRLAERVHTYPDVLAGLQSLGADVGAWLARAERAVAAGSRAGTGRTVHLDSARATERGSVPVRLTLGRGTEADTWAPLDGAPVGRPATHADLQRERAAAHAAAQWSEWARRADAGEPSRADKERARKARQKARKAAKSL